MFERCQRFHLLSARLQTSRRQAPLWRRVPHWRVCYRVRRTRSDSGQSDSSCRRFFPYSAVSFPTAESSSSLTGETVMTGRMRDLISACRIYSDWLIWQRVTRSENSAYSSSVKRVLITRRRWGVLYLFMVVDSFLLCFALYAE